MAASPQIIKKPARPLPSFRPKRSGVEKSHSSWYGRHYGGRSLDSEYHGSVFHLSPIAACGSARDDDVGEQHPVIKKRGRGWRRGLCRRVVFASAQGATALRAEGCGGALWAQIIKKPARALPSFRPKRSGVEKSHAPNDRKAGPPPPVISTAAERSGEISRPK